MKFDSPIRLGTLHASGLLDTPVEPSFDRLTKLATTALRVPVALIVVVDQDRQFFKSQCGLPEPWATQRETPLSHSLCQHVVMTAEPLIINDAREHSVLRDNLAVRDIGVVAYAGVPIVNEVGNVLGSMCAIDIKPRDWSQQDVELLQALAAQVIVETTLRVKSIDLAADLRRYRERDRRREATARLNVHDLRTPLSALVLGLELVKRVDPVTERQGMYLDLCQRNTQAVLRMVNDLLDISGIDQHGGAALRRGECNARDLLAAAIEQVDALATEKSITLSTHCNEQLPAMHVDCEKIVRVLVNLIGNAIKFTADGGRIDVRVAECAPDDTRCVQFTVADNGIGMVDTTRIFDEGVTLPHESVAQLSSGLGLAFCQGVISAHGGSIKVESVPGVGSTFHVRLPTDNSGESQLTHAAG